MELYIRLAFYSLLGEKKKKRLVLKSVKYVLYVIGLQMLISTIAAYVCETFVLTVGVFNAIVRT